MGRPSLYTDAILTEICERLSTGEPLAQICRSSGMPAYRTVKDWADNDKDIAAAIARARDEGFDAIAIQALTIADTPLEGEETKVDAAGIVIEVKRSDMLGHRKLQIETRLKLLAKWDPKRYGDRVAVDHGAQDSLADQLRAARERSAKR